MKYVNGENRNLSLQPFRGKFGSFGFKSDRQLTQICTNITLEL